MTIELTDEQQQAVRQGHAICVSVPDMGGNIVLMPAEKYETLRELEEDEQQQRAFRDAGLRSAVKWMKENPY